MSWNAYTDNLIAQQHTKAAIILGYPDGGLWASSGGLTPSGAEGPTLTARFANPGTGAKLVIGGVSYMATNCNGDFLTGKSGQTGIVAVKSGKAAIIAIYGEGQNAGSCLDHASKMAADLSSKGF